MTGPVRQLQWREEDKLRILREAFAPGAVVSDVARRHDVRAPQIYQWRSEFLARGRPSDTGNGFVAVAAALCSDSGGEQWTGSAALRGDWTSRARATWRAGNAPLRLDLQR